MQGRKDRILENLRIQQTQAYDKLIEEMEKEGGEIDTGLMARINELNELMDEADKIPLWPFDLNFLIKVLITFGLPLLLYFGDPIFGYFYTIFLSGYGLA